MAHFAVRFRLPAQDDSTPGKASANRLGHDQIAGLDLPTLNPDREGEGNGCSGGIAVVLHGDDDPFHRNAQLFGSGLDDPDVGLMRHNPVNIIRPKAHFLQRSMGCLCKLFNGVAEHFLALHPQHPRGTG